VDARATTIAVRETAAEESAYFQLGDGSILPRIASGLLLTGPAMDTTLAHGLPERMALLDALRSAEGPMLFDDTAASSVTDGFPCGVAGERIVVTFVAFAPDPAA